MSLLKCRQAMLLQKLFDVLETAKTGEYNCQPCETSYEFKKACLVTHVHTSASADARAFGTQVTTADAIHMGQ